MHAVEEKHSGPPLPLRIILQEVGNTLANIIWSCQRCTPSLISKAQSPGATKTGIKNSKGHVPLRCHRGAYKLPRPGKACLSSIVTNCPRHTWKKKKFKRVSCRYLPYMSGGRGGRGGGHYHARPIPLTSKTVWWHPTCLLKHSSKQTWSFRSCDSDTRQFVAHRLRASSR